MRRRILSVWTSLAALVICAAAVPAWGQAIAGAEVEVRVTAGRDVVAPGGDLPVAVVLDHAEGWHTHHHDPEIPQAFREVGFRVIPTQIDAVGEAGGPRPHVAMIQWPEAKTIEVTFTGEPVDWRVYAGQAVAYLPVTVPADAEPGDYALMVTVDYQACDDVTCLMPETVERELTIRVVDPAAQAEALAAAGERLRDDGLFADFDPAVWQRIREGAAVPMLIDFDVFGWGFDLNIAGWVGLIALLLIAAVGGLMLNLTPCVLPVIPLKIMGLAQMAGSRGKCLALGATMSLGVVAFWLAIGVAVASLAGFDAISALFRYPAFTIGVGLFIAVMALGMGGLFYVPLPRFAYNVQPRHDTYHGSFVFGIMAAVLATPCVAPFMGAAVAGVMTQRPQVALLVFLAIGGGMASPYLVPSAFPKLVDRMPKAGPASVLIKQVMALLMLAAASYFLGTGLAGVLVQEGQPPTQLYWWAVAAFVAAAGAWLVWRTVRITASGQRRAVFGGLGALLVVMALAGGVRLTDPGPIAWEHYTAERFERRLEEGRVVLLEFTAQWCLNCHALEQAVLHNPRVVEALEGDGVVPMKIDLTGANDAGWAKLREMGRRGIPFLAVFSPTGELVYGGDFYTVEQVLAALDRAQDAGVAVE